MKSSPLPLFEQRDCVVPHSLESRHSLAQVFSHSHKLMRI